MEIEYVRNKSYIGEITANSVNNMNNHNHHFEEVYAYLVEEPMSQSEMEEENLILFLELYTIESINATTKFFVDKDLSVDEYEPMSCIFTVTGDGSSLKPAYKKIKEEYKKNNGWIKGFLSQTDRSGVRGYLTLSSGESEYIEQELFFTPTTLSVDDKNYTNLLKSLETAAALSECTSNISDQISELKADNESDTSKGPYTVTVYNVGKANTITIEKSGRCILFDCGVFGVHQSIKKHILSTVKPDIVIISHWHEDHYNLLNDSNFNSTNLKLIIYPVNVGQKKPFYRQVMAKLGKLKAEKITLLQLDPNSSFAPDFLEQYGFDNIDVFLGQNKKNNDPKKYGYIKYNRDQDDFGIILSIKECNGSSRAIFPGDCSYFSWPEKPELDLSKTSHLVVPHHGGHVLITDIPNNTLHNGSNVYVSTNRDDFIDLDQTQPPDNWSKHQTFVRTALPNYHEHITKRLQGNGISFYI